MKHWNYIKLMGFLAAVASLPLFLRLFGELSTPEDELIHQARFSRFVGTTHNESLSPMNPTRILRGDDAWPRHYHDNDRIKFRPGSLNMTHLETMKFCHIDRNIYRHHWTGQKANLKLSHESWSEKHKLLYWMIAKSGSSGAKRMMNYHFDGRYSKIPENFGDYHKFSFVREPVSRFVSSFNEMLYRDGPWLKGAKKGCSNNYSFLFHNMTGKKDIKRLSDLGKVKPDEYSEVMRRLDHFVQVYNGRKPCNGHLRMQAPRLLQLKGDEVILYPVDEIYSLKEWRDVWAHFAETRNVSIPEPEYHRSIKSAPSYVNGKTVSNETVRAICHLMAVDYCCLNFPLPPPCAEDDKPVYCAIVSRGQTRRRIGPWKDLPPPTQEEEVQR
eukprot:scaffold2353_cov167-Amphora_coffeaeformis.AAC.36